jgi:protein-L-isoaspartate O-methyltransferase
MAKRQDDDLADLTIEPAAVQPAPALVQVRALVPMWNGDEVIAVGTVYGLPAAVAADLAGRGMVAIEEAG